MKNRISFILLSACFTFLVHASCKAQRADNFAGTLTINDTIELEDTPQAVTAKFGQPDDSEVYFEEIEEVNITRYYYNNGATFDFKNSQLVSFKFTSSSYKIKLGAFELKVGNNISTLSSVFPKSYSNRGVDGTGITLGPPDADTEYISIGTNSNGVITEIELRFIP